jgi:hypothetical protein
MIYGLEQLAGIKSGIKGDGDPTGGHAANQAGSDGARSAAALPPHAPRATSCSLSGVGASARTQGRDCGSETQLRNG